MSYVGMLDTLGIHSRLSGYVETIEEWEKWNLKSPLQTAVAFVMIATYSLVSRLSVCEQRGFKGHHLQYLIVCGGEPGDEAMLHIQDTGIHHIFPPSLNTITLRRVGIYPRNIHPRNPVNITLPFFLWMLSLNLQGNLGEIPRYQGRKPHI